MNLSLIYASSLDHAISITENNALMVVKKDQEHFKTVTQYSPDGKPNLLLVGRKTWEIIPEVMKKCSRRKFLVLTHQENYTMDAIAKNSIRSALEYCMENKDQYYKFFVIGGAEIYQQIMETGLVAEIFHTEFQINLQDELSRFVPNALSNVTKCQLNLNGYILESSKEEEDELRIYLKKSIFRKSNIKYIFRYYQKEYLSFEMQYLSLLKKVITHGVRTPVRNGTTFSIKNHSIKIDLEDGFPILTTRRSFWRGIKEELLWMLSGSTDVSVLQKKGIHIWDSNSSREYLDKYNLVHLKEGDIGPGYGFQMRYSGAPYIDCKTDYSGKGIDQISECIRLIKNDPTNRRIILNLWNVNQLKEMALPPCHYNYQFTVTDNKLSCHLYQRSWDIMLGWNTSTAALLTHILAHYCDLESGTITHTICDVHVYSTHLEAYQKIKDRLPYKLPKLEIIGSKPEKIDQYASEQFKLINYQSHPSVRMEMIA